MSKHSNKQSITPKMLRDATQRKRSEIESQIHDEEPGHVCCRNGALYHGTAVVLSKSFWRQ